METENKHLTAQQSLDIITEMIRQTQGNVRRNSFYLLLWGWVIVIANIGMYILMQLNFSMPYLSWSITIPAWIITIIKAYKHGKNEGTLTHLGRITAFMWFTFGVCIFTLIVFGHKINYQLNPLILIISAIPALTSGIILRFKPLVIGGISFWVFGIIGFIVPMEYQNLIGACAIISGYLIPGYILKNKKEA